MSVITKNLAILGAPVPAQLAATIDRRQAAFEMINAETDALGPARLAIVEGRPAEELAELITGAARHSDQRTRALALWHEAGPTLEYAENVATKEAGDEIVDTVRPIFVNLIERLAEVVDVLGPDPESETANRTPAGSRARATYQEVHPHLEATRRLRAALASVGWGHPHPGMAAWVAPDCIETRSGWANVEQIGDRAWGRLIAAGATVQLNTRDETAALLDKVTEFPPDTVPTLDAEVANRRALAELDALEALVPKGGRAVRVQ